MEVGEGKEEWTEEERSGGLMRKGGILSRLLGAGLYRSQGGQERRGAASCREGSLWRAPRPPSPPHIHPEPASPPPSVSQFLRSACPHSSRQPAHAAQIRPFTLPRSAQPMPSDQPVRFHQISRPTFIRSARPQNCQPDPVRSAGPFCPDQLVPFSPPSQPTLPRSAGLGSTCPHCQDQLVPFPPATQPTLLR